MLTHYPDYYKNAIPENGGPQIPDEKKQNVKFNEKLIASVRATLKSENAQGESYNEDEKKLMIWYNYHFLGRGKPTTHIKVLSSMTDDAIRENLPEVFTQIFDRISLILKKD